MLKNNCSETRPTCSHEDEYVTFAINSSSELVAAYAETHPQNPDETPESYHRRLAEQDFDDGHLQGALFQDYWEYLKTQHSTVAQLQNRGYYIFIAAPNTDFNPENFDDDGVGEAMSITFQEALSTLEAEPIDDD